MSTLVGMLGEERDLVTETVTNRMMSSFKAANDEAKRVEQAIGPYGISPRLHTRLWDEYLARQPDLASRIRGLASQHCFLRDPHAELGYNLAYATAIAWLVYQHQQLRLPERCDPASLARIWETSYPHRGGQASDFLQAWRQAFRQRCKARN